MSEEHSRSALVLTDNPELEKKISKTLFTLQYSVHSTDTTSKAQELANKNNYLLIIADETSSRSIDTLNFYLEFRVNRPDREKRFIFISDANAKSFQNEVTKLGCEHLSKPFEPGELALAIEVLRTKGIIKEPRIENRYNWTGECSIDAKGKHIGKTIDINTTGVKMYYNGDKVKEGTKIMVHIPDIGYDGEATVVWCFKMGKKTLLGFDLGTHLTPSKLKKAIPFAT